MRRASPFRRPGFTAVELVVVILLLAVLAGVLVPRVSDRMAAARDARRLHDARVIQDAIEQYRLERGTLPPATPAPGCEYDLSTDGAFLEELLAAGYLREAPRDPRNDDEYHYGYQVLAEGAGGCKGKGRFFVLGVRRFETPSFAEEHPGYLRCANRDWNADFEYVLGSTAPSR